MPTPITLKVFRGDELLRTEQFTREIIKIGRLASAAHLVLDDERISRIHSVIEVAPDGAISIIDMGSKEGTFVNGKKVSRGQLRLGDQITMGGLRLVLEGPNTVAGVAAVSAGAAVPAPAGDGVNRAVSAPVVAPRAPAANGHANGANGHANGTNGHASGANGHANGHANGANGHANGKAVARAATPAPAAPAPAVAPAAPAAAPVAAAAAAARPARRRNAKLRPAERTVEDLSAAADLGVELRLLWGDTLLEAATFVRPPAPVHVGSGDGVAIRVEGLPHGSFPMLRWAGGDYQFAFDKAMGGVLDERGARTALQELVKSRRAAVDEKLPGAFWIPVPRAGAVRAELGAHLAIEARPRQPEKVQSAPWWERLEYRLLNLFVIISFLALLFMVFAENAAEQPDNRADDLTRTLGAYRVQFATEPPKPVPQELAKGDKKGDPGEAAEKHKGEEGQAGKKDAPKTNARSAPRAIDPNAKDAVRNIGLVGAFGRGGGGLSTVMGPGGLGGDLHGAVGNLTGPVVGDSQGLGGLGMRGSGTGGGGSGETIGIGAVGTKGRGGGMGGYGTGVGGLGKKGDRDVSVSTGTAVVMGAIDKELVRKVIQDHAAQIRYCYETQLALNPRLQGKVAIKWQINADGSASLPQVDASATTLEDAKVHECMMARITSWQFPKPKGGGIAVISYPWILRSSGAGGE